MHIQIEKEDIYPILSQIQGILEKRSTLPIFVNILVKAQAKDKISIYASDSELSFSASFSGKVKEPGELTVSGKKLFEIVRELESSTFDLSSEENYQVKLQQNQSLFKVHGLNPKDFPTFPPLKKEKMQKIPIKDILEVIDRTLYCVSLDESRYHLTGVFLDQVEKTQYRFVATDGHRMSYVDIPGEKSEGLKEGGIIIPRKGLQEVKKMLAVAEGKEDLEFSIEKPRILFRFKNQMINVRLIEGKYPDYKKLLPKKQEKEILISTKDFMSSLRRISVLTSARFKGIHFIFKDNLLKVHFSHPEIGEANEELNCQYKGEKIEIRFNSKYILDILQTIHEEDSKIILKDSVSPGLIQPKSKSKSNYTCLVMPMKL